jgi:hypothetical protein
MQAKAIVFVTIEVQVPDVWGQDTPVKQVHEQAKDSAGMMLRGVLGGSSTRVIEMRVKAVIAEEGVPK